MHRHTGLCLGLLVLMTACGGELEVGITQLTFMVEEGQPVEMKAIPGSLIVGDGKEQLIVQILFTNQGIEDVRFQRTGTNTGTLEVYPRDSRVLAPGEYKDTITISACYDEGCFDPVPGSPQQVDVTYTVTPRSAPPGLQLSGRGVALARVPSGSRLTRTLNISAAGWTATADQPWLTVTPSSGSSGVLTLSANPEGLRNGFYAGRVTVASGGSEATVRVGLYVSAAPSATGFSSPVDEQAWVADPVRPYIYSRGNSSVHVNHIYTGARVGTIAIPGGALLGDLAVGDDGSRLYALDSQNTAIVVLDLDQQSFLASWPLPKNPSLRGAHLAYARVAGITPVLLLSRLDELFTLSGESASAINAESGQIVGGFLGGTFPFGAYERRLAPSGDGNSFYSYSRSISSFARYALRANSRGDVWGVQTHEHSGNWSMGDVAVYRDGSGMLVLGSDGAGSAPRTVELRPNGTMIGEAGSIAGPNTPTEWNWKTTDVEIDSYDRILIKTTSVAGPRLRLYAPDRTLLKEWDSPEGARYDAVGTLRISGDGLRAMGNGSLSELPP